jgi:hypothetical protein
MKRTFPNAADGRKDSTLVLHVDWLWRFTLSLSQDVKVSYEAQNSTRTVNTYHRQVYSYGLNIDF